VGKKRYEVTGTINVPIKEALKIGLSSWTYENKKKELVLSVMESPEAGVVAFPRNLKKFVKKAKERGIDVTFVDKRIVKKFKATFKLAQKYALYEEQQEAVDKVLAELKKSKDNCVILKAPPGFGKSYALPYVVQKLGVRTLVIVDRTDLVQQMLKEFEKNVADGDVGVLSSKDKTIKDVNITTFQFLIRNKDMIEKLAKEIGFVVVDECHVISIGAFTEVVNRLPAKYRLGLSATPTRSDGLTDALYDVMGHNIVEGENPSLLKIKTYLFNRPHYMMKVPGVRPNIMWADFYESDEVVNEHVRAAQIFLQHDRAVLIYSIYSGAQRKLKLALNMLGIVAEIVNQKTPKEERKKIFQLFQERKIQVLISGTIVQKGLSLHRLDTVINAANHTKESLEQLKGRLRRSHKKKKTPLFIDFLYQGAAMWKSMDRADLHNTLAKSMKEEVVFWSSDRVDLFFFCGK